MYEYLLWIGILAVVWLLAYTLYPKLRKKLLWSSLVAVPFGVGELFFIPQYWQPQTLFNLGMRYGIDIESFLLMFVLGGVAAFVYEAFFKRRVPLKQAFCHPRCYCYLSLAIAIGVFAVAFKAFPELNIIYVSSISCLAGGLFAAGIYPKLRSHIVAGGVFFAAFYLLSLALIDLLSPGWIAGTWNMASLSGITLLAVPIEELLFGFCFGTLWTSLYEETCKHMLR